MADAVAQEGFLLPPAALQQPNLVLPAFIGEQGKRPVFEEAWLAFVTSFRGFIDGLPGADLDHPHNRPAKAQGVRLSDGQGRKAPVLGHLRPGEIGKTPQIMGRKLLFHAASFQRRAQR